MKRIICLICAAAMCLSLCACGRQNEKIDMYELQKSMVEADKSLPEMKISGSWDENAEKAFSYISDMEYNKIYGFFLAYAADGMAYEIAVVQLKDQNDVVELGVSLSKHVDSRVQMYKTYEPDQVERAQNAAIKTIGDCVLLMMCDGQQNVETAFRNFTK